MTIRVLDLTTTLAGAYSAHLLTATGVDVTRVEPPDGVALRRWSASGAEIPPDGAGPMFGWLAGGISSVVVDPHVEADVVELLQRAAGYDAITWSPGAVVDIERLRAAVPGTTITALDAVRPRRAMGRPGRHRVHAASTVRRARPARVAGVAADVRRRPARRVHDRRVRRRRHADRPAADDRQRRGRGPRRVRPGVGDDDPAVQPAHDGDAGRRRPPEAPSGHGGRRGADGGRLRRLRGGQPGPALARLLRHDRPPRLGRRPHARLGGDAHRAQPRAQPGDRGLVRRRAPPPRSSSSPRCCGSRASRSATGPRSRRWISSRPNRSTTSTPMAASCSRRPPSGCTRRSPVSARSARHRHSGRPSATRHDRRGRRPGPRSPPRARARSRACASPTSRRSGPGRSSATSSGCSAPTSCTSSRPGGPTAPG